MPQRHSLQHGIFHVTTCAAGRSPWCTYPDIPDMLIENLLMTQYLQNASLHAFCILPDHMHLIITPGEKGLSNMMHSFKRNASWQIQRVVGLRGVPFTGWQGGFHMSPIRDESQFRNVLSYVQFNPLRHGFVDDIDRWKWSSIHFPNLIQMPNFQ